MSRPRRLAWLAWLGSGVFVIALGWSWLQATRAQPGWEIGSFPPEFVLPRLAEGVERMESPRGRVSLVHFWATWCAPCRAEAPELERLYRELGGDGFELLGVSVDSPDARQAVEEFRDEYGLSYPILLDPDQSVYRSYRASGLPETFLLDAQGRLRAHFVGPRDWKQPRFVRAIDALLHSSERIPN